MANISHETELIKIKTIYRRLLLHLHFVSAFTINVLEYIV